MEHDQDSSQTEKARPSRRPADTDLTQQRLPACKPVLDPCWIVFIFASIGIILIPIGAISYIYGVQPQEVRVRYDQTCFGPNTPQPKVEDNTARRRFIQDAEVKNRMADYTCTKKLQIPNRMEPPIYVYYELDGFYQNHRRYVKSRSDAQLAGLATKPVAECKPVQYTRGKKSLPILPCGLVAWSYFNDTFKVVLSSDPAVKVQNDSLASEAAQQLFADKPAVHFNLDDNNGSFRGGSNLTVNMKQDHRFILWMETAPMKNFRKLYGRIDKALEKGQNLTFEIVNRYNTFDFDGQKWLVIGTTSWLGGKNQFLGLAYLATGATSCVLGLVYSVLWLFIGRKIGDTDAISWPVPPSPHH